jgi:hypothetical protein
METKDLLSRAKASIEAGESKLRAAAEDIAAAYEQGATQREVAEAVGKSAAWVNRLLSWRKGGYVDETPFGPQSEASRRRAALVQSPKHKQQTARQQTQEADSQLADGDFADDESDRFEELGIEVRAEDLSKAMELEIGKPKGVVVFKRVHAEGPRKRFRAIVVSFP